MFVELQPKYGINYKAGQAFFTRNEKSIVSNGISWLTYKDLKEVHLENNLTHCGICIGDNLGIEADWSGVKICKLDKYFNDKHSRIVFREPVLLDTKGDYSIILKSYQIDNMNIKYDYKQLIGFGIIKAFSRFLKPNWISKIKKVFDTKDKYICSELVMKIYCDCGFTWDINHFRSPREVFEHPLFKEWKK